MAWYTPDWRGLAEIALGGTIVLALGSIAARACREPAHRARIVVLTVVGCLFLPWLGALPIVPRWSAGMIPVGPPSGPADRSASGPAAIPAMPFPAPPMAGLSGPGAGPVGGALGAEPSAGRPAGQSPSVLPSVSWPGLALLGYGAGASGLAAWWLIGQAALLRVVGASRPVRHGVRDRFLAISGPAGDRVRLLESDRIALPFTFTWTRPTILMPAELCDEGDSEELRFALAHEWSHVERRDYWSWTLTALAGLLLFYQPLFWWLRRQLRLCQDYLADDRAASVGSPEAYAAYLVRLARCRVAGPNLPALGIGDRRSNLHRRVVMLVQDRDPWERRCRTLWGSAAAIVAVGVMVVASGVRLDASPGGGPRPDDPKEKPAVDKPAEKGPTLEYSGTVKDKETGQPIEGATVTVRRSVLKPGGNENRRMQETKHTTDAAGKYSFSIPPEQSAEKSLYIELDLEHPDYATQAGFGYALVMIRKNETMGGRPFFENLEMLPGKPVSGRVQTPEGAPAKGVKILAFSRTDKYKFGDPSFSMGSFTRATADDEGRFRVQLATPGLAVFWILTAGFAPEVHPVPVDKRGDLGLFVLKPGVAIRGRVLDAEGRPAANVFVNAERDREQADEILNQLMVSDAIHRSVVTDSDGSFALAPLPAGTYQVQPGEHSRTWEDGDRSTRPLPGVFVAQKVKVGESEAPEPLEIRAVPHVVIEAQWVDSKGKPTFGFQSHIFGRIDKNFWMGEARVTPDGKAVAKVPHGLEDVQFGLMTNEHHAIKYRTTREGPLLSGRQIRLGTLDHDFKGIEIVHYNAPILTVKGQTRDGKPIPGLRVTADYTQPEPGAAMEGKRILAGGLHSDVSFEVQEDGRHRSEQLSPDREVAVTAQAEGFQPSTIKVNLPEGKAEDLVLTLEPK